MKKQTLVLKIVFSSAILVLISIAWPVIGTAANGQQCAATSKARGQFCSSPFGGFPNQAQCIAAYNGCLNAMPRLIHNFCVQIDQPNCNQNDDCPQGSCCNVHPVNQQNRINLQCFQDQQNRWQFEIFDVADCKCDCSKGVFPVPENPEGPEVITLSCEAGTLDCSGCTEPGDEETKDTQVCAGETVPWGESVEIEEQTEIRQELLQK